MEVTLDTWIISDTHFGHKNIVKYCDRPVEHNELMEKNWRERVAPTDQVLHLGDLTVWYGKQEEDWLRVASGLPGKKFLLRGNHDLKTRSEYAQLGYTIVREFTQEFDGIKFRFSHDLTKTTTGWDVNVHGHIHNHGNWSVENGVLGASPRRWNVSVEVMEYKPVRFGDLIAQRDSTNFRTLIDNWLGVRRETLQEVS